MSDLSCTEYQACDAEKSCAAKFYCLQCISLQCALCEEEIHRHVRREDHERLTLNQIDDEFCSIDESHAAIFYCATCARSFCYSCYITKHQLSDGRKHKPQKFRDTQEKPIKMNNRYVQQQIPVKQIYPNLPSDLFNNNSSTPNERPNPSTSNFQEIQLDNDITPIASPSVQRKSTKQRHIEQKRADNQNMFDVDQHNRTSETKSDGVIALLDASEQLLMIDSLDFIQQLKSSSDDPSVKCLSIIGNTGHGKSYTLNQVFFDGDEKFSISPSTNSCTMGVWAALDNPQKTLLLDTEGLLGLSLNDNIRKRLLLKILCISDVVIFRTAASRLPNDMFQFLSDASSAFLKYFKKEIENVMKNCNMEGPMSSMGPTLIIFHQPQHTEVLKDDFRTHRTAVEQVKERFDQMSLPYDAYSSIEYVGIGKSNGKRTDFGVIKTVIDSILENNRIRSPRRLSVIFKALKALNEKFNHAISSEMPSILPDEFFTCGIKCLACGAKCGEYANHDKDNIPHQCKEQCSYNKELDNEIMKCVQCDREGLNTIVYGKLIATKDNLVEGFVRYVWSGSIIECPKHGEIHRSRKYWFGNTDPKQETRVEIIHVWPGNDTNRPANDVTPRKVVEAICTASSYISGPAQKLKEIVADQIAPEYWAPNRDAEKCSLCELKFGLEHLKHHCRACGNIFCDTCTSHRIVVPLLDVQKPQRVCNTCYGQIQSRTLSSVLRNADSQYQEEQTMEDGADNNNTPSNVQSYVVPNSYNIPISRRLVDTWKNNVSPLIYTYPIEFIKAGTRPKYWRPDNEYNACLSCKHPFNSTTHRLHHCRKCGECFCHSCSPNKRPVPERGWANPERVCIECEKAIDQLQEAQT